MPGEKAGFSFHFPYYIYHRSWQSNCGHCPEISSADDRRHFFNDR